MTNKFSHSSLSNDPGKTGSNFLFYGAIRISVLLRLRRDFVLRKLVRKQWINIHAALRRFRKM